MEGNSTKGFPCPRRKPTRRPSKPTHKAIQQFDQSLKDYRGVGVKHEGAVETAFQRLLEHVARLHHCRLIPIQRIEDYEIALPSIEPLSAVTIPL